LAIAVALSNIQVEAFEQLLRRSVDTTIARVLKQAPPTVAMSEEALLSKIEKSLKECQTLGDYASI